MTQTASLSCETKETGGFALSDLWRLPFRLGLMLASALFSRTLARLRKRPRALRPPKDWQNFYPQLRLAEWSVREITIAGVAQLLVGKPLDLSGIEPVDPPEHWVCPMPRSPAAMHRRIEDVTRFFTDMEACIRRRAARLVAGNPAKPPLVVVVLVMMVVVVVVFFSRALVRPGASAPRRPFDEGPKTNPS